MSITTTQAESLVATRRHAKASRFCVCGEDHACKLHNRYFIHEAAVRFVALSAFWASRAELADLDLLIAVANAEVSVLGVSL